MSEPRTIELSSGKRLDYFLEGDGDALVVYHHGTPAAGPIPHDMVEAARRSNLTVVELVRPGYGGSTRQAGRTIADVVPLVIELVDHLGADRFVTMGWSGGGPHAIATAALLPDRCAAAMSLAGVAPYGVPDLDFLAGMGEENIEEFGAALAGAAQLETYLSAEAEQLRDITPDHIVGALRSLLPDVDQDYLHDEKAAEMCHELQWSLSTGIWGWSDDDIAFCLPWGFDLADVSRPVQIWQGSVDLMVPFAHGRWLAAHVPGADAQLVEGEGHLSLANAAFGPGFAALRAAL